MKVITIGGATKDIFIEYSNPKVLVKEKKTFLLLEEGKKIDIQNISYYSGGGATNSAVSFKRLGFDVMPIFKIGNDHEGQFILKDLKDKGLSIQKVLYDNLQPSSRSFIIPSPSGNRSILTLRGANEFLCQKDISKEIIDSDLLYITSLSGGSAKILPNITKIAKTKKIMVAANPGQSQLTKNINYLKTSLSNIDVLILNSHEANLLITNLNNSISTTPSLNLEAFFEKISSLGPHTIVVTDGENGVYVSNNKKTYFQPSIPTKVISTVGAGDAFGSCFIASLIQKKPIEESMLFGVKNSSSVISFMDAKTGLLGFDKL